jgi:hypothetical protein
MNPCVIIKTGYDIITLRLEEKHIRKCFNSFNGFNDLVTVMALVLDSEEGFNEFNSQLLPLGPELSATWLCSSPVGYEYTTPPLQWMFEERLELAMTKETHPLMVLDIWFEGGYDVSMVTRNLIERLTHSAEGHNIVISTDIKAAPSFFGDGGDDGGTC